MVKVEKPECKKWFDDLTKNNGSVNEDGKQTVTYNVSDPYVSSDEIQKQLSYQVTAKPVFSGCMQKNGQYVAYTQQGTIIHGMSQANCKRLIQDADRPFNYFANDNNQDPNRQQDQQQQQNFIQNPNQQMSAEDIAKYHEAKRQGLI